MKRKKSDGATLNGVCSYSEILSLKYSIRPSARKEEMEEKRGKKRLLGLFC